MGQIINRGLGQREKIGIGRRILIQNMDVNIAFRKVGVDPVRAANVGYVLGRYLLIYVWLQFGWRGSPGWWGVIFSAIQQAQRQATKASATILPTGRGATAHVRIAGHTGIAVEPAPQGCIVEKVDEGGETYSARVGFFMDDAVSVEVQWEAEVGRCLGTGVELPPGDGKEGGEGGATAVT